MRYLLWILLFALPGCGAVPTPTSTWQGRFPTARFIAAEAQDATPEAAADAARARVAAQIASRIRASIEVETREANGEGAHAVRHKVATQTGFARAELIKVPTDLIVCADACRAVAVLDRGEAVAALRPEYDAARARFARAAEAAEAATEPARFTLHLGAARAAHGEAQRLGAPLRVIGGDAPGLADDRARQTTLDARADALLAQTPIALALEPVDADLRAALGRALVTGFAQLGLRAAPTAECTTGLRFVPQAAVDCGRSALGPRCRLHLTGSLTACSGAPVTALDFSSARLAAVHPRSQARARAQLVHRVAEADLSSPLRANLNTVLPVRP